MKKTLIDRFEQQVEKRGNNLAVKTVAKNINYNVLNCRANQTANILLDDRKRNGKTAARACILFEHDIDMIVGMMGVLKAGKTFIPLDPTYPEDRLSYMLQDSESGVLVVNGKNIELASRIASKDTMIINIDDQGGASQENPRVSIEGGDLAYIMYTSGSTGRPKGVPQSYQNIMKFIGGYTDLLHINAADKLSLLSSYSHTTGVIDIFSALLNGAALCPYDIKSAGGIAQLTEWLRDEEITIFHSIPTLYRYCIDSLRADEILPAMRLIVLGGEALSVMDVDSYKRHFKDDCIFVNLFGSTEVIIATAYLVDKAAKLRGLSVPVGYAMDGVEIFLLNEHGEEVPDYAIGEIVYQSKYLATGYWNHPEKTRAVFTLGLEDNLIQYRSGDLGRMTPDGCIEFLGRKDFQVKIRGYRIEVNEIEMTMDCLPGIKKSVVTAFESNGENYLAAYYTVKDGAALPEIKDITEVLNRKLPEYMVPAYFMRLENLPLTPNGKIDRKALPEPNKEARRDQMNYVAPRNGSEAKLVEIWKEILGVEKIGVYDNFFELGGHSLKATVLVSRIHQEFGVELPLKKIFEVPTVETMTEAIAGGTKSFYIKIDTAPEQEYYPVSSAQKRMYILYQVESGATNYNIAEALVIEGALDRKHFEIVIRQLGERHESFRTSFELVGGVPAQRVHRTGDFAIKFIEAGEEKIAEIIQGSIKPFDLSKAPLLRVTLIKAAPLKHYLIIDMHHIISDGVSMNILVKEFMALYAGRALPDLKIQYHDYVAWQRKQSTAEAFHKQETYWLNMLAGEIQPLNMPLDFKRPARQTNRGRNRSFVISRETAAKLNDMARAQNITLNTLLFSIYTLLLHKYSSQTDIIIGSLTAGRRHADLAGLIGLFINFLPVRQTIKPEHDFLDLLNTTHKLLLEAYENQDYPFEDMIEKSGVKTESARNPLFDTMFIFHNEIELINSAEQEGLHFEQYPLEKNGATLDIKLDSFLGEHGEIACNFEYNTDLFKEESIVKLIQHFNKLTESVISAPKLKIKEIELFTGEEKEALREKIKWNSLPQQEPLKIAISATFTAEPLADYIRWWCNKFNLDLNVEFAPYNQVFQELLAPESLISNNTGANLLLVRFEDWIRFDQSSEEEKCQKLGRNLAELTQLFKSKAKAIPYFVGIFPVAPYLLRTEKLFSFVEELNKQWKNVLEELDNVYVIDFTELNTTYNIEKLFDQITDETGHLPFSDEFYAAMGAMIARKIRAWRQEQFKLIVLDCDNTLWKGICGEDGALGVEVSEPYRELQQFMVQQSNEGMLLALCSKNNEADLWEVFEKNPGMILKKEDLVASRINWQSKPANLESLAAELNLSPESFIFIDDNPAECFAMMHAFPNVLTLRLPEDPEQIPSFLRHIWAFDRLQTTVEDRGRKDMYLAERKRLDLRREGISLTEFIQGLQLKVSMNLMDNSQVDRVAQLTQRTNQFNLSSIRRTRAEIEVLAGRPEVKCWVVEVVDRFGDYGLVGVIITLESDSCLFIDTFLLSCRVLGRTVEDAVLTGLRRYCGERGLLFLEALFYPTAKNGPFSDFIAGAGWEKIEEGQDHIKYRLPVARIKEAGLAGFYYQSRYPMQETVEAGKSTALKRGAAVTLETDATFRHVKANNWEVFETNGENLLHRNHLLPPANYNGTKLLNLPVFELVNKSVATYEAPGTEIEKKLAAIWRQLLGAGKIGINDSFFELGGNSLRATTLLSKIHQEFNAALELRTIFDYPTIKKLARKIDDAKRLIYHSIERVAESEYYPVSSAQKRMYILNRIEGERISYNNPGAVRLEGNLDRDRLAGVVRELVKRHESFRTSFEMATEEPVERIHPCVDFPVEYIESGENGLSDIIGGFIRPFDLSRAPLLRIGLIKITENSHILIFDMHHIISDGVSIELLTDEFIRLYNGEQLPEIRLCYKDFAVWQRALFQTDAIKGQREFWQREFNGEIPVISLPTDYQRPALQSFEGAAVKFELTRELSGKLNRLALDNGATLYMLLLAVFNVLLYKYTGQDDLVVGTPVSGRRRNDLENIIGMFVNTLALRNQIKGTQTFQAFLENVKENVIKAYENQDYQFEELVEQLEVNGSLTRDLSRNPVFDVMFVLHNKQIGRGEIAGIRVAPYPVETGTAKFDLLLQGVETENGISFSLEFGTKLFKRETVERICGHFQNIVNRLVSEPGIRIDALEMITKAEKWQLLHEFNDTAANYPQEKTIHGLLAEQAGRIPDHIAAIFEDASLTYRELNVKANQLARSLREKGVKPNSIVGIMVERSLELLIGILGILKAGGAYLPINPEYPEERIRYMLEDSKAAILLTQRRFLHLINPAGINCEILALEDKELYQADGGDLTQVNTARDLIYLIYTSGSTGNPKGVMLEHYSVVNRLNWMQKQYPLNETDTILQKTPFTFDVSVWELFWWLFAGAKVYFLEPGGEKDPALIIEKVHKRHITTMHFVPSMLQSFLEYLETAGDINSLKSLRQVFASGEALSPQLVERFNKLVSKKLHNLYGPTEAAVDVSYFDCSLGPVNGKIPIGKPIANIQLHILNKDNQLQPVGIPGELCISGHGLARGYLGRPELTAEKFVPNPFIEVDAPQGTRLQRMYRTGDLARRMTDGNIEFLGRLDHQVKVRGFRIELGEIENRLLRHDSVKEAAVMDHADAEREKYLCAYLVTAKEIDVKELREYLAGFLPEFMIPSYFVMLEKLPLTSNGKVDRKALSATGHKPEQHGSVYTGVEYQEPETEIERILADIFKKVLGIESVGIRDNFFHSGGDSIKAIQVAARAHQYGLRIELKDFFKYPEVKTLAQHVVQKDVKEERGPVEGEVFLTPIQEWFFEEKLSVRSHFNQAVMLERRQGFDEDIIRIVWRQIVKHHDALRMVYRAAEKGIRQFNLGPDGEFFSLEIFDLKEEPDFVERIAAASDKLQSAIDLENGPLTRLGLFKTADGDHLLIAIHHLVIDGVSWRIILDDFAAGYMLVENNEAVVFPGKTDSYRYWSEKLRNYANNKKLLQQRRYWGRISGTKTISLPKDNLVKERKVKDSEIVQLSLSETETSGLLRDVNQAYHTEINDILLAALGITIAEWTGEEKVLIYLEGHGREEIIADIDLTRTVGWFTSLFPVALEIPRTTDLARRIKTVKECLRCIPDKGIGYGLLRYLTSVEHKEGINCEVNPEICFNYLGQLDGNIDTGVFEISVLGAGNTVSPENERPYALDINGAIVRGRLVLSISYDKNEFNRDTIARLGEEYRNNLTEIITHCSAREESESTPSDFGDTALSIIELDRINAKLRSMGKSAIRKIYPLAPMQKGMLYNTLADPGSEAYFQQISLTLSGVLDMDLFERSIRLLGEKHEILRTVFIYEEVEIPRQVVIEQWELTVKHIDISELGEGKKLEYINDFKIEERKKGFDLTKDVLVKVSIFKTGAESYEIVWSNHHIILDGWCMGILVQELFSIYGTLKQGNVPDKSQDAPYSNFISWLGEQDQEEALSYWENYLKDYETRVSLPKHHKNREKSGYILSEYDFTLDDTALVKLDNIAKDNQVTLNTVIQAIWGILLQRYNNAHDVVFGSVVSGRPPEVKGIETMIGLFINTIPVRVKGGSRLTFRQLVRDMQNRAIESLQYDYLSLAELQSVTPLQQELIDHILVFENYPVDREMEKNGMWQTLGFTMEKVNFFEQTNYNFNLIIIPGNGIEFRFKYNTLVYDTGTMRAIEGHFREIAKMISENPAILMSQIEMLTDDEKGRLLHDFNDTVEEYRKDKTIHELFEEQAGKKPDGLAVICGEKSLTYRELNEKANRLARAFRSKGMKPDSIVGLMVERSLEMIIAILGVLKAGGAYLPIDPGYPADRVKYMLGNSGTSLLLTHCRLLHNLETQYFEDNMSRASFEIIGLEEENLYTGDGSNLDNINTPQDLAYVIYTSGSTGKPKGVMIEHSPVINRLHWMQKKYPLGDKDVILQKTPYTFDVSVWELLWWSLEGAKVCFLEPGGEKDPALIAAAIQKYHITTIHFVPSMLNTFISYLEKSGETAARIGGLKSLRRVFASGEALNAQLVNRFNQLLHKHNQTELHNLYGPTEATVDVSYFDCSQGDNDSVIPIGKPIDNIQLHIINKDNQLQPVGVPGELCISGDGLARGYLGQPELTAEKFVPNPFIEIDAPQGTRLQRMYRTGDLACRLPDGNIEFLGRMDHQVKVRGFRIELGEIESCLLRHEFVKEAVVSDQTDADGAKYLCAYLVSVKEFSVMELREYLLRFLPEYMIPSYFVMLEKIPLTANGKVNRKALTDIHNQPASDRKTRYIGTGAEYVAPRDAAELKLAQIWKDVLGIAQAGIYDNFFESGGHSLKAVTLVSRIHREFNVELALSEIFKAPTIQDMARAVGEASTSLYSSIEKAPEQDYYPVSSAQKRMYILSMIERGVTSYNIPGAVMIEGELDRNRFEAAVSELVRLHESFRTSFEMVGGEPMQKVHQTVECKVEYLETGAPEHDDSAPSQTIHEFIRPFDLSKAPLLRIGLIRIAGNRHILIYDMHHIISDGASMEIMTRDFISLYNGEKLTELKISYKDFSEWQNRLFQSEAVKKQEEYWLERFNREIPALNLPTDYVRPALQSYEGASIQFELDHELAGRLNRLALESGATIFMVLLAAFNLLLYKYSGQEEIIVGAPVSGRRHADLENVIGMFVNTLAFLNQIKADKTFKAFLETVKANALNAYENQDYQFEEMVERLELRRDLSRNPLFDVMFILQNTEYKGRDMEGLKWVPYPVDTGTAKFDILLQAVETDSGLSFSFEYCVKLFKRETMERMAGHFRKIIEEVITNPDLEISRIDMLTEPEIHQILVDFNDTAAAYRKDKSIQELFEEQVMRTPEKTAVVFKDRSLSYRELNEKANKLARFLRNKGVEPQNVVGLMVKRSLEMMIGILGILKAGGAYLPLDPGYPAERTGYIITDSQTKLLLTNLNNNPADFAAPVIDLNDNTLYQGDSSNLRETSNPRDMAYIIYTSGSTGKPKGVIIEHQSVHNLIEGITAKIEFNPGKKILANTAMTFDIFVLETLLPLTRGLKVIIAGEDEQRDPKLLKELIKSHEIEMLQMTPSLMRLLVDGPGGAACFETVKEIMIGGEPFPETLLKSLRGVYQGKLYNMYGPTETTVWSGMKDLTENNEVNIGKPICNTKMYICGKDNRLQPVGVPGELCIAGDGLARGYLNRPDLTAERFIPNPFYTMHNAQSKIDVLTGPEQFQTSNFTLHTSTRERAIYRTGDCGKWLSDGNIEFIGRMDHQVKIRGHRIELGEIESRLLRHALVKEAVVIDGINTQGDKYLCAYLTTREKVEIRELRAYLSEELPDYMIPEYFIQMDELPLTLSGKVNRKALPGPENIETGVEYLAPQNVTEARLVNVWKDVLGVKKIGINDNFFELGGNSLRATTLLSKIHQEFNTLLELRAVFINPTVKKLALEIDGAARDIYRSIETVPEREYYPVSSAQKRMYILNQIEGEQTSYNSPGAMMIESNLNRGKLEEVIKELVKRHASFRTSFEMTAEGPAQRIHPRIDFKVEYIESGKNEVAETIRGFIRPFDLSQAPLLRVGLIKIDEDKHILIYDMHHIITDGTSMGILAREFIRLYNAEELPEPRIQYKDFAVWQNRLSQSDIVRKQEEYWLNRFAGELPVLNLPTDFPRPAVQDYMGDFHQFELGKELTAKMKQLALNKSITLFTIILAAYNVFLAKLTGQEDIIIGIPVAGRRHADLQNVIGMFINTVALRNYPRLNRSFADFLTDVNDDSLLAFENQDYQFEMLLDKLGIKRDLSRNPLFDITLNYFNNVETDDYKMLTGNEIQFKPYPLELNMTKFDLIYYFSEMEDRVMVRCHYRTSLFKKSTIEYIAEEYCGLLEEIAVDPEKQLREYQILDQNGLRPGGNKVVPKTNFEMFGDEEI